MRSCGREELMQPRGYNALTVFTRDGDEDDYAHGSEKGVGLPASGHPVLGARSGFEGRVCGKVE